MTNHTLEPNILWRLLKNGKRNLKKKNSLIHTHTHKQLVSWFDDKELLSKDIIRSAHHKLKLSKKEKKDQASTQVTHFTHMLLRTPKVGVNLKI